MLLLLRRLQHGGRALLRLLLLRDTVCQWVLHHAQQYLGLKECLGQLRVLDQDLARLLRVLLYERLHLIHNFINLCPGHFGQRVCDLLLSCTTAAAQNVRHCVASALRCWSDRLRNRRLL